MMTGQIRWPSVLGLLLALCAVPLRASAQDPAIVGSWKIGAFVAPGVFSDTDEEAAALLEGRQVRIGGDRLIFSGGADCAMGQPRSETWHDDMASFGSAGGAWSRMGLVPKGPGYQVEVCGLDCTGALAGLLRLVVQTGSGVLLIDVRDGVYVPLERLNSG